MAKRTKKETKSEVEVAEVKEEKVEVVEEQPKKKEFKLNMSAESFKETLDKIKNERLAKRKEMLEVFRQRRFNRLSK